MSVGQDFHAARVDGNFAIVALVAAFYLDRKKQQLEFRKAKPVKGREESAEEKSRLTKIPSSASQASSSRVANMKVEQLSQTN